MGSVNRNRPRMSYLKKTRLSHRVCPHCDRELNIRTYKEHKRLYFREYSNSWYKTVNVEQSADDSDGSEITPPPSPPADCRLSSSSAESMADEDELDPSEDPLMDDLPSLVIPPCETRVHYGVSPGQFSGPYAEV